MKILNCLLLLVSCCTASAKFTQPAHVAFHKKPMTIPSSLPSIQRGGAVSVVAPSVGVAAAKLGGSVLLIQGISATLAPLSNVEIYSPSNNNPTNIKIMRRIGTAILSMALPVFGLIFKNYSLNTVLGFSNIPWMVESLTSLLNNESEFLGPSKAGDAVILALTSASFISGLNDLNWAKRAAKAASIFGTLSGLGCLFAPKKSLEIWECKDTDDLSPAYTEALGANLVIEGFFCWNLASGMDPLTIWAYTGLVAFGVNLKTYLFADEVAKKEGKKVLKSFWLGFSLILGGIGLLTNKEE